ncbi:MAG: aromatic ring-hydroxylating dioxygenase subunit alpha [Myxococcota bacterium]
MSVPEPAEPWPDAWWGLCRSASVRPGRPHGVTRLGRRLVLWRDAEGQARCAHAACPHRGTDLSLGSVQGGALTCRYHGFRFGADGACTHVPCEGADAKIPPRLHLRGVPVIEAHGYVFGWLGDPAEAPAAPGWVPDAPEPSAGEGQRDLEWPVRLGRAVESMLDIHHLVHAHPIAAMPGYTRLEPFDAEFDEGGVLRSTGRLRRDDRPGTGLLFRMDLAPPAQLCLRLTEQVDAIVVCTPIDAENTWLGLRYRVRVPWLGALPGVDRLVSELAIAVELGLVQPDDLRMVGAAEPRGFTPADGQLVHADKAIALWHGWRERATRDRPLRGADVPRPVRPARPHTP